MDGSPQTMQLPHPPWPNPAFHPVGTQIARAPPNQPRRVMSAFHHHLPAIGSPPASYPIVYSPIHSQLPMSTATTAADALHSAHSDYYPNDFPFDAQELPSSHSLSQSFFPSSNSISLWPVAEKSPPAAASVPTLSPVAVKREPNAQAYSPSRIQQSASGRFYESSTRFDDSPQAYGHQHQQQHQQQQHQQQSVQQSADYPSADLSPLQSHHVFYGTESHDSAEYPPEHRHHHRRHPSSGSIVPADFFAPPQAYIEPAELDYASPTMQPLALVQHDVQPAHAESIPFPTADTPSPPEYGSSPGLTEDADDSVESDVGEDDDEYDPVMESGTNGGGVQRRRRRSTLSSGYSDASTPLARRRRVGRTVAPVPVPNLTKKSRGRRVPTDPVIVVQGGVQKDLRTYCCNVAGCGKRFARGEHLKRHVRSIHTNEKPHRCPAPGCGKEFSRHDNLGQHMRVHKGYRVDY